MSDLIVPDGSLLRDVLEDAAKEEGCSLGALTVLADQNDPFRCSTPAGHRDGQWFAGTANRLIGDRRIHLRGFHYAALGVTKPNGAVYENNDADWVWSSETASKRARWLEYTPFDRIIDQRNTPPVVFEFSEPEPEAYLLAGITVDLPSAAEIMPRPAVWDFRGIQPYRIVQIGEKSSLEDVLAPIGESHQSDLYLPAGELSDSYLHKIATDAAEDGRDLVVLDYSDADPGGWQMGISIARKLQALQILVPDMPPFEVYRVALTPSQVRAYGLPSTPLKDTEKRGDRWKDAMGQEQTEIDSLASLQPGLLREIALEAIRPFFDYGLAARVAQARADWVREASRIVARDTDAEMLARIRREAATQLAGMRQQIADLNDQLRIDASGFDLPELDVPEAELTGDPPPPLLDSSWSFARQSYALINSKRYGA